MSATISSLTPAISLRNTVWLAIALALVAAPHAERLPVWLSALAAALCAWRLYLARMRLALPARWVGWRSAGNKIAVPSRARLVIAAKYASVVNGSRRGLATTLSPTHTSMPASSHRRAMVQQSSTGRRAD